MSVNYTCLAPICVYIAAMLNNMQAFSKATVLWHEGTPKNIKKIHRIQFDMLRMLKKENLTCQGIEPFKVNTQASVRGKESSFDEI